MTTPKKPLSVGQRVRIHFRDKCIDATVTGHPKYLRWYVDVKRDDGVEDYVPIQWCRRLRPKKREPLRSVWICEGFFENTLSGGSTGVSRTPYPSFSEFREVRPAKRGSES